MDLDEARSAAEARRQRILDSAANRMDQVSGLAGSDGKEAEETATTLPTSSKLAAMRKRRFRKSSAAATTEGTTTTTTTTPKETTESSASKEMTPPVVQAKETTPEPAKAQEEKKPTNEKTEEKKYVGVAKMRRKMIKEKQQKKQEEKADEIPVSIPKKFSKVYTPKPTWQIMMHLLTVLFLFLAGFEVGLQQSVIEYRDDLTIHETLAPQQEMRLLNKGMSLSSFSPTPAVIKEAKNLDPPTPYVSDEQDEFGTAGKQDAKEEKLDPLFGVDLDALTAGPGLFMMFGRFAVSVHRMILSFLYYLPIRIWNNALSLVASPPVLCLATLAIRQASHAVGGKLPELIAEEAKTSTQPQDIMTTIKNGVTSLIGRTFPTATKLYEAWTHLRSDMYVVMCGLFVGLVWHHYLSSALLATPTGDEL